MTQESSTAVVSAPVVEPHAKASSAALTVGALAAMLLIVAAALKAYGVMLGPQSPLLRDRVYQFSLIEFELLLGGMLLLGALPRLTWATALATFTIFAGVSVRKAMLGASSCGCFGPAAVNPRVTVAIDAAMILLLLWAGPRAAGATPQVKSTRMRSERIARFSGILVVTLLMLSAAAVLTYCAIPKRGLVATQGEFDFGAIMPSENGVCDHTFIVRNTGSHQIRIVSCQSSCSCTVANCPADPIAPGATADIRVRADWSNVVAGEPYARVTLTTDDWRTRTVPLVIHAQLAPRR